MTVNQLENIVKSIHTKLAALVTAGEITQTESDAAYPIILEMRIKNDSLEI